LSSLHIDNSYLSSSYSVRSDDGSNILVGATRLFGSLDLVGGTIDCAGVYQDLVSNYTFFANTCP
jgi:hypothetical protein